MTTLEAQLSVLAHTHGVSVDALMGCYLDGILFEPTSKEIATLLAAARQRQIIPCPTCYPAVVGDEEER